jgi:hypothetical protein
MIDVNFVNSYTSIDFGNKASFFDRFEIFNLIWNIFLLKNDSEDLAVCMEGAFKNYGHWWKSTTVLHDINVHVPKGIMYYI